MPRYVVTIPLTVAVWLACATLVAAQESTASRAPATAGAVDGTAALATIAAKMDELQRALEAMRTQLADARQESQDLRQQLAAVRADLEAMRQRASGPAGAPGAGTDGGIAAVAEEQALLGAKVVDLEQTKVESGSKYHLRLSGMALVNVVGAFGSVDDLDIPTIAQPGGASEAGGSFSVGVRQSMLGVDLFGPTIGGARTSGDLKVDFFAGFPAAVDGLSSALVRLRTTTLRADWKDTSVVAGQDVLFFSPRSPTSLASSAYPALASAGNLWTWTPQVDVERRFILSPMTNIVLQAGILDALTGEPPASEYSRLATAGERSRVPATAFRLGWQHGANDRTAAVAVGGYYSRQNWGFDRAVNAWAATADWDVPIGRWLALSGEMYRGRAIGGLGGGAVASVLFDGAPASATSAALALDSLGGWSQIKAKPSSRVEFNLAFGAEHSYLPGMGAIDGLQSTQEPSISRNASGFINAIYQLRSNVLFSVEYRRLWTTAFSEPQRTADHISVTSGIVF